jgi:peptidoglycan/LPS O-acetylase OafA/YrhL
MGLIRLLLALSVLRTHAQVGLLGENLVPGNLAVECFYLISGFYMAMVLNEKYVLRQDYLIFLQQRFFRLYPTYFTALFLTLILDGISSAYRAAPSGYYAFVSSHALDPLTILAAGAANLFIFGQDLMLFFGLGPDGSLYFTSNFVVEPVPAWRLLIVPQAWSLGVEVAFYLLAPLLLRKSIPFLLGLIVASLALRFSFAHFLGWFHDPWSYRFFPFELAFFLLGSVAYRIYGSRRTLCENASPYLGWLRWPLLLALLNYLHVFGDGEWGAVIMFALCFLLLPFLFLATKTSSFDKLLGELSYPLYLTHLVALQYLRPLGVHLPERYQGILYAMGAILLAYPICRWVDYPVERFRHSLLRGRLRATAIAAKPQPLLP